MKQALKKPIMILVELDAIEDVIRLIGGIINHKNGYCHDEIEAVKQFFINKAKNFIRDQENKEE